MIQDESLCLAILASVLVRVLTVVKRHRIKGNISLELAYSFRGLVRYHHGGTHGNTQADLVLEK